MMSVANIYWARYHRRYERPRWAIGRFSGLTGGWWTYHHNVAPAGSNRYIKNRSTTRY